MLCTSIFRALECIQNYRTHSPVTWLTFAPGALLAVTCARDYNEIVARGWESKSVEGQIESFASDRRSSPEEQLTAEQMGRQRERNNLLLSRKRVIHDIEQSRNPRHVKMLRDSLAYLDSKIAEFD